MEASSDVFRSIFRCCVANYPSTICWQVLGKSSSFRWCFTMSRQTMKQYLVWYFVSYFSTISAKPLSMRKFLTNLWQDLQLFWSLMHSSPTVSADFGSSSFPRFSISGRWRGAARVFCSFTIFLFFLIGFCKFQFFYKSPKSPPSSPPMLIPRGYLSGIIRRGCVSSASSVRVDMGKSWVDEEISVSSIFPKGFAESLYPRGKSSCVREQSCSMREWSWWLVGAKFWFPMLVLNIYYKEKKLPAISRPPRYFQQVSVSETTGNPPS